MTAGVARPRGASHEFQCVVARLPVEQPGRREHERTRAHGPDAIAAAASEVRHGADEGRVSGRVERAVARRRRSSVSIGPRTLLKARAARRPGPRVVSHRAARRGRDDELVAPGRAEHLMGPDQVERGDPRIDDEDDAAAHGVHCAGTGVWQQ